MNDTTEIIDVTPEPEFGRLVVVEDSALLGLLDIAKDKITACLDDANAFELTKPEDKDTVKTKITTVRSISKDGLALLEKHHQTINTLLERVRTLEKPFLTPTTPNTKSDPEYIAYQAEKILKDKLNARLDLEERKRIAEENRLREQAEKDRQKRLDAINNKLDKLTGAISDLVQQKEALESSITDDISIEEAEAIRARIEGIEAKLAKQQGAVITQQTKVQEVAVQTTIRVETPKVQGVASKKKFVCVSVSNEMALLRAIVNGQIPAWKGIVSFNLAQISRLKNMGQDVPGADFQEQRDTRIR